MKKIILILYFLGNIIGYANKIENGAYYGEVRDGAINEFKVIINNIDDDIVQILYYYRYIYRISDSKETLNLMMNKKGKGYYAEGKNITIYVESIDKETLILKITKYGEKNEVILKKYKEAK